MITYLGYQSTGKDKRPFRIHCCYTYESDSDRCVHGSAVSQVEVSDSMFKQFFAGLEFGMSVPVHVKFECFGEGASKFWFPKFDLD